MWCNKALKRIWSRKKMKSRKESFIGLASENDLRIALHYVDAFKVLYESNKYQDQIVIPALFKTSISKSLVLIHFILICFHLFKSI